MESKDQPYVIISRDKRLVLLSTGVLTRESYDHTLRISRNEGSVIYSRYGISEEDLHLTVEALGEIHGRLLSEVSGEVGGLVKKLKGETQ